MKVICIDEDFGCVPDRFNKPIFGEYYTVTSSHDCEGILYYTLDELSQDAGWDSQNFAQVSNLDETIIHEEVMTQTA